MCKEHIKALKQVLKGSKGTLPILKCLEHSNGTLKATDLTVMVQIKTPTIADGIWKPDALDYGFKEDTKETEWDLSDYPELPDGKLDKEVELDGQDMAKIIRALDFVSKDTTRPVLTGVVINGDRVYGCDGYKLYRNKLSNDVGNINLPTECVKVLKSIKADKLGTWTLDIYEDERVAFTNGNFTLYSKLIYGNTPDYDGAIGKGVYDYMFRLDMKQIKGGKDKYLLADKDEQKLYIADRDGGNKILISECLTKVSDTIGNPDHIEVVMPLSNDKQLMLALDNMKQYKNKVDIRFNENTRLPVYVEEL